MLGIEMMDKNSGNEGGAIINIASMSGEFTIVSDYRHSFHVDGPITDVREKFQLNKPIMQDIQDSSLKLTLETPF